MSSIGKISSKSSLRRWYFLSLNIVGCSRKIDRENAKGRKSERLGERRFESSKRGGVAALSALSRRGHLLFRLLEKRIASAEVIDFLGQMLRHHPRRHLVVVMDQAPPHTSKKATAFIDKQPRLHVFHLPKYSPDWNPDEKVWNHLKHQELKSHQAKTKEELKQLTRRKLESMAKRPHLMRGLFFRCCVAELFK